jgi:MOSC domain-containing protein YiiM
MRIEHLYISPGHNYFGHHGQPAGTSPVVEVEEAVLKEGKGIEGDRFFAFKENYKGQITFFSQEVYESLCAQFQVWNRGPEVFRRNAIVSGVDLNGLIGVEFTVQSIRFLGVSECTPCHWMDEAFHPGAEAALQGRGGLRAKVLSSGILKRDSVSAAAMQSSSD